MSYSIVKRTKRKIFLKEMEEILSSSERQKRTFTADEQKRWDELTAEIKKLDEMIESDEERDEDLRYFDGIPAKTVQPSEWTDSRGNPVKVYNKFSKFDTTGKEKDLNEFLAGAALRFEKRQQSSTDSAGGFLIPANLSTMVIQKLIDRSVCLQAGAQLLDLQSDMRIAKITGWPTAYWRAENAEITASDFTFDGIDFAPKTCAILVKASRELVEDASNLGEVLTNSLVTQMGFEMDKAALVGDSNSAMPDGITNFSGLTTGYSSGSDISDFTPFLAGLEALWKVDVNPNALIMPYNQLIDVSSLVATDNGQPLIAPKVLTDLQWFKTTKLPARPSQTAIMGDFTKLLIGLRNPIRVFPLSERFADFGQIGFLAWMRLDIQAEHEAAFTTITTSAVHT